jgi:ATP phosphoribosyltransferase
VIRLALPKGRTQEPALDALRAAGLRPEDPNGLGRRLRWALEQDGLEVLLLKDWDLPRYVEEGVADCGIVGSDVLEELDGDLLVPVRLRAGRCRLSLVGRPGSLPAPGAQARLATKYPRTARRLLRELAWSAEVVELQGSLELAPLLDLAEVALDIVQTGRTLREHGLVELEVLRPVAPCLVVNRASLQRQRPAINELLARLERAEVVE